MPPRRLTEAERIAIAKRVTEKLRAAERPTTKSATSAGDKIMDKTLKGLPVGWKVEKQADGDVKVFMPSPDGWVEVDQDAFNLLMTRLAGKGTSTNPGTPNSGARFPGSASIVDRPAHEDAPRPPAAYEYSEPNVWTRSGPNFVASPIDPGIAEPLNFEASEPGPNPASGAAPAQLTGESAVMKSATVHGKVAKGTFRNLVDQSTSGV